MFNWLLCSCFVTVVSLFFHIFFTIHCRTHLPPSNLIHRPSLRVIWTMVKQSCKPSRKLSSKPLSKTSGSPGVYADDTASNTSHFFWSNCIICVSCIICANCIISTYCLNSPNISTFSKLSPSIIKSNWNKFAPLDVDAAVSDDAIRQTRRRPTWTKRQTTCLIDRSFAPN